jgi:hypothetical protein
MVVAMMIMVVVVLLLVLLLQLPQSHLLPRLVQRQLPKTH